MMMKFRKDVVRGIGLAALLAGCNTVEEVKEVVPHADTDVYETDNGLDFVQDTYRDTGVESEDSDLPVNFFTCYANGHGGDLYNVPEGLTINHKGEVNVKNVFTDQDEVKLTVAFIDGCEGLTPRLEVGEYATAPGLTVSVEEITHQAYAGGIHSTDICVADY